MMRVLFISLFFAFGYSAEIRAKLENVNRSADNSTSSGCQPHYGIVPDENCKYLVDDMKFTEEELLAAYETDRNGINLPYVRWPTGPGVRGQMAYEFDRQVIPAGSDKEEFINRVIARFNVDLAGCLKIVPRQSSDSRWVRVSDDGSGCNSAVGRDIGCQFLTLNLKGAALGIFPEYKRTYEHKNTGIVHEGIWHPIWFSNDNQIAIWYIPQWNRWAIGPSNGIGKTSPVAIISGQGPIGDLFSNDVKWYYWNNAWKPTSGVDDVNILCSSNVQILNLAGAPGQDGCYFDNTVAHEFIHAWGFTHEQNRPDRDDYINIDLTKYTGADINYKIQKNYLTYGVQYDGLSVMQYPSKDTWGGVMTSKRTDLFTTAQMGTNDWMTLADVSKLRQMYGCDQGTCTNKRTPDCDSLATRGYCDTHQSYMNDNCKSSCNFCNGFCKDVSSTSNCQGWAKRDDVGCHELERYSWHMQNNCRKTCNLCPSNCKDNKIAAGQCADLAGRCQENSDNGIWIRENCRKTCKLCLGMNSGHPSGRSDEPNDPPEPEIDLYNSDTNLPEFPEGQIPDKRLSSGDKSNDPPVEPPFPESIIPDERSISGDLEMKMDYYDTNLPEYPEGQIPDEISI